MAVRNILPQIDLKVTDICDTLNANGGIVSNDVHSLFTTSANIKMWARYKPVRLNQDFTDMSFYKAEDGNCGLHVPAYSHPIIVGEHLDGGLNGWAYQLPRGKTYNEPFRLGDFRNYNPHAEQMFLEFTVPSKINKQQEFIVSIVTSQDDDDSVNRTCLVPRDLSLADHYFGAYITGPNANFIKTASNTIGAGFGAVSFDVSNLSTTHTYSVYPFLCSRSIPTQTTTIQELQNAYKPIPYTSIKTFTVNEEPLGVHIADCQCTVTEGTNIGVYEFKIVNCTPGAKITDCYITIKNSEGLTLKEILLNNGGSIGTVASGTTTFTYSNSIEIPSEIKNAASGKLCVSCEHNGTGISYEPTWDNIWFEQPQE